MISISCRVVVLLSFNVNWSYLCVDYDLMKGIHSDDDFRSLFFCLGRRVLIWQFESSFEAKTQSALGSFLNVVVRIVHVAFVAVDEDGEDDEDGEEASLLNDVN